MERLRTELVLSAIRLAPRTSSDSVVPSDHPPDGDEASLFTSESRAPMLSLMDNAVLRAQHAIPKAGIDGGPWPQPVAAGGPTARLLRALLPSPLDFLETVQSSRCAWDVWRGVLPIASLPCGDKITKDQSNQIAEQVSQTLLTDSIGILVKLLMGLAICLQQLPQEFESTHTGLPAPPASLQEEAIAAAESVLAADQRIADTIDGLECMIIQSKYYINMGKPRTAWLIGQRALSTCHVFGVHNGSGDQSDETRSRWEAVRLKFWNRDRQLSLLLGLPYASPLLQRDLPTVDDAYINTQGSRAIWMQLGVFSGHVTDRNLDPKKATFSQTLDIDHEMETFKSALPFERLESPSDPNLSLQAIEDIFLSRFIFHNIRKLLHLPYMLMAMTDKRFEYSRDAALNASREMLGIYLILRDPVRPVLSICKLEDFHTLTAAMVLIINLLGRPANPVDLQDAERDWLLVQDVAEEFRSLKVLRGCSVAKQGSRQK